METILEPSEYIILKSPKSKSRETKKTTWNNGGKNIKATFSHSFAHG